MAMETGLRLQYYEKNRNPRGRKLKSNVFFRRSTTMADIFANVGLDAPSPADGGIDTHSGAEPGVW